MSEHRSTFNAYHSNKKNMERVFKPKMEKYVNELGAFSLHLDQTRYRMTVANPNRDLRHNHVAIGSVPGFDFKLRIRRPHNKKDTGIPGNKRLRNLRPFLKLEY